MGLRWWNEVDPTSGDSHWVFESSDPAVKVINSTDNRFFWIALYSQPLLWVALAVVAIFKLEFIWLTLVGEFCSLFPGVLVGRKGGKVKRDMSVMEMGLNVEVHEEDGSIADVIRVLSSCCT